jgi:hypothetical protein
MIVTEAASKCQGARRHSQRTERGPDVLIERPSAIGQMAKWKQPT